MRDVETLKGLLERVQASNYGNYDLDQALFALVRGWSLPLHGAAYAEFHELWREHKGQFTDSTDAALSLVKYELPDWGGRVSFGSISTARLWNIEGIEKTRGVDAATPALAICAALLSALIAQAQEAPRHGE